ncbi:hypothetical protein TNCV_370791 [Trichonephila clavipes]|nr:hypothetical protein TNCV_370791 [Trichonephila clavipes]
MENQHLMQEDCNQFQFKIDMWAGLLNRKVFRPCELTQKFKWSKILEFYSKQFVRPPEDEPFILCTDMWLQQDVTQLIMREFYGSIWTWYIPEDGLDITAQFYVASSFTIFEPHRLLLLRLDKRKRLP